MNLTPFFDFAIAIILVVVAAISFYMITGKITPRITYTIRWVLFAFWVAIAAALIYLNFILTQNKTVTLILGLLIVLTIAVNLSLVIVSRIARKWTIAKRVASIVAISIALSVVLMLVIAALQAIFG
jgi:hypothetical protein